MKQARIILLFFSLFFYPGCKETYDPPAVSSETSYLVVEGALNAGPGATSIRLTRTYKIENPGGVRGELNAAVTVEDANGGVQPLAGTGDGYYISPGLNLVINNQYRLRIKTTDGNEYLSDAVTASITPPVDTVKWSRDGSDLRINVSTHDPANATRYYRWEFEETWEVRSFFASQFIYEFATNTVRERVFPDESVIFCWKYHSSDRILLGSSTRLQEDVINEAPLHFIAYGDERLDQRYSILVKQYGITAAAYEFYELMKRNTEEVGSVFGPLPSELRGNIRCISDPGIYALGFITASSIEEKRIFIDKTDVPDWRYPRYCIDSLVDNDPAAFNLAYRSGSLAPYSAKYLGLAIIGYYSSFPPCVDCTLRGGSTQKPAYW